MVIEYTARDTPQQNSPSEVGFCALANKACASMHTWYQLFGEIFTTATLLDGLTVSELNGKHYTIIFCRNTRFCLIFAHCGKSRYSEN